ncbi:MAG: 2-oxo-4-hydroxy-4-carboxy-5-ureidoimidazoline decarboxylase [Streptosporangiales bacterium]|nr:2-oxo-4-hydroxy-4-carboxy-5-ureidoimidazoline decarboxylase [Streptosporangiales bacterium]
MTLDSFNRLEAEAAAAALAPCCASPGWAQRVAGGRPYRDVASLVAAGEAAFDALGRPAVEAVVAAHPRIGERPAGDGRESAWSREEQSSVRTATGTGADLAAANAAYEQRFDRVFLVCATGLSALDVLAEAKRRLGNDEATEWTETTRELRKIVRLRLTKMIR